MLISTDERKSIALDGEAEERAELDADRCEALAMISSALAATHKRLTVDSTRKVGCCKKRFVLRVGGMPVL